MAETSVASKGTLLVGFMCGLALLVAPSALADSRTNTFSDPQDAPPVLSGEPNEDVQSATLTYDTAGSITLSVRFYAPVNGRTSLGVGLDFTVSSKPWALEPDTCSVIDGPYAGGSIYVRPRGVGSGILTVTGTSGALSPVVSRQEDGRVYTAVFSHAALANRDWRCGEVGSLRVFFYEFSYCDFSGCPITSTVVDDVKQASWFPGFAPVPLTERIKSGYGAKVSPLRPRVGGALTLSLRNVKLASNEKVGYRACIARRGASERCRRGSLRGKGWDEIATAVSPTDARPLRVRWIVAGSVVATKRLPVRTF